MRTRLLAVAFATAVLPLVPSYASSSPAVGACNSLVRTCAGGCGSGYVVTVRLIGHGYAEASCGDALASCESFGPEGCTGSAPTASPGTLRCIAYPQDPETVVLAVCTANTVGP
jgi:hypothetical protein